MRGGYEPIAEASSSRTDMYELGDVEGGHRQRPSITSLFMPRHVHEALNSYKRAATSSHDSDADDSDEESEAADGTEQSRLQRLADNFRQDLEAQPAWAAGPSKASENNTLKGRLAVPTIVVLVLLILAAFFAGHQTLKVTSSVYQGTKKKVTVEDWLSGKFYASERSLEWLAEAGDGVYSEQEAGGSIKLHDIGKNTSRELVQGSAITDESGNRIPYATFSTSHDLKYILFGADRKKQWRHSSHSNFWVHEVDTGKTTPLGGRTPEPTTSIAKWSPQGHSIAYVRANDLYLTTSDFTSPVRITSDGNETIFNGVPDWVYEEEVFGGDSAVWWSPDGRKLAFLRFDESDVHTYSFPIYNQNSFAPGSDAYPTFTDMKYPKPGTPNPKVTLYALDLDKIQNGSVSAALTELNVETALILRDRVVTEVAWVSDHDLMVRETTRDASRERVVHFDFRSAGDAAKTGKVTRDVDWEKLDGGWAEASQTMHAIDAFSKTKASSDIPPGYLDVIPDKEGFVHIAFFSPPDASTPVFLTTGKWEVTDGIDAVDLKRNLIYFRGANPSIERHVYSVPLPTTAELDKMRKGQAPPAPTPLTDNSTWGFYDVSFSPEAGFYLLTQRSGLPFQTIVNVGGQSVEVVNDNANLNKTLSEYRLPVTAYKNLTVNGVTLNVAETTPPNMDESGRTKYPVLFRPYGGPNSQTVQARYRVDWTHCFASEHGYIVVEVDGRGTGFLGRAFRSVIRKQVGKVEAADQIAVAQEYAKLPYVDAKRIGIQGWSFGGYLTAKVLETNTTAFALGISVAPVTDWRYYDTIYTERYMGTLETNRAGYDASAVTDMEGFRHAAYLLMHGSGDDNVHFLNSAALLDRLTVAGVDDFSFRMFTDSAHNMGVRGAYASVFRTMTSFLLDKLGKPERVKVKEED